MKITRLIKRTTALLTALILAVSAASLGPDMTAYADYHDTNMNTFIHPFNTTPKAEAGTTMVIKMNVGYTETAGLNNPHSEKITDVHVRLSNDESYLLIKNPSTDTIIDDTVDDPEFQEWYSDYLNEHSDGKSSGKDKEYLKRIWEAGRAQGQNDMHESYGRVYYAMPMDTGDYPFEVTQNLFTQDVYFESINRNEYKEVSFTVTVRHDMKEGYYAIPVTIYYNIPPQKAADFKGNAKTEYINVYIEGTETDENKLGTENWFSLGEGQLTPQGTYPEVMNYNVNLKNVGDSDVYDVTMHMNLTGEGDSASKFPFNINEGNYDRYYESLKMGETVAVPYSMAINEETYTGDYPLTYTIEFRKVPEGTLYKEEQTFYVHVNNKDKEDETAEWNANTSTKARLIVDSYRLEPEKVYAGESFNLIVNIKNASKDIPADNILLTFSSEETAEDKSAVFSTENGANSVVINSLPAGSSSEVRMSYTSRAGIAQGSYKINIKEQYDSPEFKNAEETVSVDVPVYQYAKLSTSSFEVSPASIEVGSESNVMFGINNTGKVTLYNVSVTFEGTSIKENNAYIGNIKPGETGNVDVMLTGIAETADDGMVKAVIKYEDENGTESSTEKEFELYVTPEMPDDMYMPDPMLTEEPEDNGGIFKIVIPVAVIAAAGIVAVVIIKKMKKKKEEDEITDSDDEI